MTRLIDADRLKAHIKALTDYMKNFGSEFGDPTTVMAEGLEREVDIQPTVEAEPVRYGRWEDCSNGWMCSVCGRDSTRATDYCPHCGARMVGGEW